MFWARWRAFPDEMALRWGGGELPAPETADTTHWYDFPFWC